MYSLAGTMCGRFTRTVPGDAVVAAFEWLEDPGPELRADPEWARPRYNVAPGQRVLAMGQRQGRAPRLAFFRWGLIPRWSQRAGKPKHLINARLETVHERKTFRTLFERRRCLVPADGWFEWPRAPEPRERKRGRPPFWIHRPGRELFTFAAVWDRCEDPGGERTFALSILTRDAEGPLADIHPRMPVVVPEDLQRAWLDPLGRPAAVREALLDAPLPELVLERVSACVNDASRDDPGCLEPSAPAP